MTNDKTDTVSREIFMTCKFEAFYHSVEKMGIYLHLATDLYKEIEIDKNISPVSRTTKRELISYLLTSVVPCYNIAEAAFNSIHDTGEGEYRCNLCCDYRMLLPEFFCPLRNAETYTRAVTQYTSALVDFDHLIEALKSSGIKLDTSVLLARGQKHEEYM